MPAYRRQAILNGDAGVPRKPALPGASGHGAIGIAMSAPGNTGLPV
jgi:hypothetical protein